MCTKEIEASWTRVGVVVLNPGNWPPLAVSASGNDCTLSPKKYRPVSVLLGLNVWSTLAMKLVRLLNEGELIEAFGPRGQPLSSVPTKPGPNFPGMFGAGNTFRASSARAPAR